MIRANRARPGAAAPSPPMRSDRKNDRGIIGVRIWLVHRIKLDVSHVRCLAGLQ